MLDYRAYLVGDDGHIRNVVEIQCANDEDAKERARQLLGELDIELWQLDRQVARFERSKKNIG